MRSDQGLGRGDGNPLPPGTIGDIDPLKKVFKIGSSDRPSIVLERAPIRLWSQWAQKRSGKLGSRRQRKKEEKHGDHA
jgi:hypothetical protein